MDIRELSMDHIAAVRKLMLSIFTKPPWNDVWTDAQLRAYISELMGNPNSLSFGVYQDGQLIGMALGRIKSWYEGTEYWIDEFGVLPEMQHSGIGSEFMGKLEMVLAEKGIKHIALLTERHVPAYHFYQKNGFDEQEETVFFVKKIPASPGKG